MARNFDPHGWVLANDGTAAGLVIARLHAVAWADGVAPDGIPVRVFAWWSISASNWGYEVWPEETSIEKASSTEEAGRLHTTRVYDERGLGVYDDEGHKVYTFKFYDPMEIQYTTPWRIEHGSGASYSTMCHGCMIEDLVEDLASDHRTYGDGR